MPPPHPILAPVTRPAASILVLALALAGCSRDRSAIEGSGTIELDEVDVSSLVGGRIERLFADEGDTVALGDTLAILERGEIAGWKSEKAKR